VVRAAALLGPRPAGALALATALAVYSALAEKLPAFSDEVDVFLVGLLVVPATFGLVWLALPFRELVGPVSLALLAGAAALLAILFSLSDLDIAANFWKLAAATLVGWWFLSFFEAVWWVLLVALLIVPVDLISVARGPTKKITTEQPEVFDALSIFLRVPGEVSAAQLGLPDVLFFALFLGAAVRFGLRRDLTWLGMALSFGGTFAIAVFFEEPGVAALPLLSLAFLVVNADLLWAAIRRRRE
jgi:hypothetical protein